MDGRIFYNPLAALGRLKGLIGALVVIVLLGGVAFWGGVHLDGALDLHITNNAPSAGMVAAESLIAWLTLGIMFFVCARVFGGGGSMGDHLAASGLGRFPFIFAAIISSRELLGKAMLKAVTATSDAITVRPQDLLTPGVIAGSFVILMLSAWMIVALLYGFETASKMVVGKVAVAVLIGIGLIFTVLCLLDYKVAMLFVVGVIIAAWRIPFVRWKMAAAFVLAITIAELMSKLLLISVFKSGI